jgi:hypothetical protein
MKYDLGFFDQELGAVTSAQNPFGAKVTYVLGRYKTLPMCPEWTPARMVRLRDSRSGDNHWKSLRMAKGRTYPYPERAPRHFGGRPRYVVARTA